MPKFPPDAIIISFLSTETMNVDFYSSKQIGFNPKESNIVMDCDSSISSDIESIFIT